MTTEISVIGIFALLFIGWILGFIIGGAVISHIWQKNISEALSPGWAKKIERKIQGRED
jgi:hypothetical protein